MYGPPQLEAENQDDSWSALMYIPPSQYESRVIAFLAKAFDGS
jgi:hypothetical protein